MAQSLAHNSLPVRESTAPTSPVHAGIGAWLLVLHLALSPLIFCVHTVEVFEENKVAFLKLIAWTLAGVGLSAWIRGAFSGKATLRTVWERVGDVVGRNLISGGVVLFVVSAAVSTWFSISPLTSWRGVPDSCGGLQTILGYGVLFLATRALCRTVADGWRLLSAVVFATAVVCCHALLQTAGYDPIAWDGVSTFAGHLRPFGTLAHANSLGAYLVMTIPLVAACAQRAAQERRWFAVLTTTVVGVVSAAVVFVTLSRAAWLGLGVGLSLLILGWWFSAAKRAGLALAGTTLLCVGLAAGATAEGWFGSPLGDGVRERLANVREASGRRQIWRSSWEMFRERPLTGSGLDTFRLGFGPHRTTDYWRFEGDSTPSKAHNEFLHVLATQGSLGGAAVLVLLGGLGRCGLRAWRRCGTDERPLIAAVLASLAGFLVTNLTGFTVVGCGGLFVCCAALLSRWQEADAPPVPHQGGRCGLRRWPAVAGTVAVLIYAINLGLDHFLLCVALGGCGTVAAWPLLEGDFSQPVAAEPVRIGKAPGWGWLLHMGLGMATIALTVAGVWCPFQASRACALGDHLLAENPGAARTHYERAVAWDSGRDLYRVKLSAAVQLCARQAANPADQLRDFKEARALLEQAVTLVPADPYHHANRARLLGEVAYNEPAKRQLAPTAWDDALRIDPKNICFIAESARGALALGDFVRARQLARNGLNVYPDHALFQAQLGACALAEGHLNEAAAWYEKAVHADWHGNADDEARAYAALASCHLGLGHAAYARDLARHATALQPHWPTAALLLSQALEGLGDYEDAYRAYQHVLTVAPHHAAALAGLRRLENCLHHAL